MAPPVVPLLQQVARSVGERRGGRLRDGFQQSWKRISRAFRIEGFGKARGGTHGVGMVHEQRLLELDEIRVERQRLGCLRVLRGETTSPRDASGRPRQGFGAHVPVR
jgi:hypothetical protein